MQAKGIWIQKGLNFHTCHKILLKKQCPLGKNDSDIMFRIIIDKEHWWTHALCDNFNLLLLTCYDA